jgi:cellulose synthase/poly-beta-1,6-N-acetylglucosamine synthase-like glycosyltransferase
MGNVVDLLLGAVNAGAFILCGAFIAYVALIVIPLLRHRPGTMGDPSRYHWAFLVPCLDEERVVRTTVQALLRKFPRAEVWCVDDASVDATPVILAKLAAASRRVHVVSRRQPAARQGKGSALNAGWRALATRVRRDIDAGQVIVGVVDADGHLDPNCLRVISGPGFFGDPDVGAVQVKVRVKAHSGGWGRGGRWSERFLVRMQDMEFSGVIAAMQMLRRHLGSVGMGGNGQFTRLSVLNRIAKEHGSPWHGALLEDFELGLHVLLGGSRTEYCHDTWVVQEGLPSLGALVRQRSRWAQGSIQCLRYLVPVLRSPRVSTSAALEIAYFLFLPWVQMVGGLLYLVCLGIMVDVVLTAPGGSSAWLAMSAWGIVPLFVCFGLAPLVVWGPIYRVTEEPRLGRLSSLMLGLANWPYIYVHHAATWWAFIRVLRSRNDWMKTDRIQPAPSPLAMLAALWMRSSRQLAPPPMPPGPRPVGLRRRLGIAQAPPLSNISVRWENQ